LLWTSAKTFWVLCLIDLDLTFIWKSLFSFMTLATDGRVRWPVFFYFI
jgi:hypothetical protein